MALVINQQGEEVFFNGFEKPRLIPSSISQYVIKYGDIKKWFIFDDDADNYIYYTIIFETKVVIIKYHYPGNVKLEYIFNDVVISEEVYDKLSDSTIKYCSDDNSLVYYYNKKIYAHNDVGSLYTYDVPEDFQLLIELSANNNTDILIEYLNTNQEGRMHVIDSKFNQEMRLNVKFINEKYLVYSNSVLHTLVNNGEKISFACGGKIIDIIDGPLLIIDNKYYYIRNSCLHELPSNYNPICNIQSKSARKI